MAGMVEAKKTMKYSCLSPTHTIMPVAIETLGAIGPRSLVFLKDLGARMRQQSGEERAGQYVLHAATVSGSAKRQCCVSEGHSGWSDIFV